MMMQEIKSISKNKLAQIRSLFQKKVRDEEEKFVVQGEKLIRELLNSDWKVELVCGTEKFLKENFQKIYEKTENIFSCTEEELISVGYFSSNNSAIAIVKKKNFHYKEGELTIVLDSISDPGNLGTIIRTAAWFGIKNIVCSEETVDFYNPKTIQATMGTFLRANIVYADVEKFLREKVETVEIFATDLQGQSIYKKNIPKNAIIVFGSESHGISANLYQYVSGKILIPPQIPQIDSLNVAVSVGIVLSEICRK